MTETKTAAQLTPDLFTPQIISELIRTAGPCITVILPPYRPGEPAKSAATILKTDLQEAAGKLAARKVAPEAIEELIEPLRQLSHEEGALAGSAFARVIFRAPGVFRQFQLRFPPSAAQACMVGDCFFIRPLFKSLAVPDKVYVLDLSKKSVSLLACTPSEVLPVQLPKGTPQKLDEITAFDAPDHDLMNRSAAGPSTGGMGGVKFGTGYGREAERAHLHDFYRAVDRGVNHALRDSQAPLILSGVEADVNIYSSVNTYPHLAEQAIPDVPGEAMSRARLLHQAQDIALFGYERRAAQRLEAAKERYATARFSVDLNAILRAAAEGRVIDLYLDENAGQIGTFEGKIFGGQGNWRNEELLNVAAVEALMRGSTVYSLPSHAMPGGAIAAATFRY